ncbi:MAG: helix-turn-helix transcriptional regulator [Clostridium sp.]|nr:helix-turn-helix transcriptional regulator [Clostridium sp.]
MENELFLKKLGSKIKILRNNKKYSQEGLASLSNLDRNYISLIENGKANPSIIYLKQIAQALEVDIKELFNFVI